MQARRFTFFAHPKTGPVAGVCCGSCWTTEAAIREVFPAARIHGSIVRLYRQPDRGAEKRAARIQAAAAR